MLLKTLYSSMRGIYDRIMQDHATAETIDHEGSTQRKYVQMLRASKALASASKKRKTIPTQ